MSFQQLSYGPTSIVKSLKETLTEPFIEGAAGIVTGIISGDYVSGLALTTLNLTGTMALAAKGGVKFGFAGVALFLTNGRSSSLRVLGLGIALGSVTSFFIDLLTASPWSKQLGLSYARANRLAPSVSANQTTLTPYREVSTGTFRS